MGISGIFGFAYGFRDLGSGLGAYMHRRVLQELIGGQSLSQ